MSRSETSLPQEAADPSSGVNENHAIGEAGRASQSGPSENHIGLNSSRLNPAGRSDHPTKPRLLDLFCGAGGCTAGYQRAGFYVVGVDIEPQPNYCGGDFIRADALEYVKKHYGLWAGYFDAIHASPPCQAFTTARVIHGRDHLDLLTPCRELLEETGLPWVIENVPGAPMRRDLILCGSMFGLGSENGGLIRHRWFEFWEAHSPLVAPCQHREKTISVFGHGGHIYHGVEDWRKVMDIDWMTRDELAQAIPPAYTEFIGDYLLAHVQQEAKAA